MILRNNTMVSNGYKPEAPSLRNNTRKKRMKIFAERSNGLISEEFLNWLIDNGFCEAPASTKHHGNYKGGLFDHCEIVAESLQRFTDELGLKWSRPESPLIIGLFHDLCKIDSYEPVWGMAGKVESYEYNTNSLLKGHGEKSIMLLSRFMTLTEEEILCIRYHMGAYETDNWEQYGQSMKKYETVLWTHTADMYASKVCGV